MSATISQPAAGQSTKSAAPFGAVALVAGALALGAIGIAFGQGIKAAPAAGAVPADVQHALLVQRMGEKAPLFPARDDRLIQHQGELADAAAAAATTDGILIQHQGELRDRMAAAAVAARGSDMTSDGRIIDSRDATAPVTTWVAPNGRVLQLHRNQITPSGTFPISGAGPKTAAQKGLVPFAPATTYSGKVFDPSMPLETLTRPFPGKAVDDAVVISDPYAGKTADDVALAAGTADRWTVLAANPYSQGLLSRTVHAPIAYATGGVRLNDR